MMAMPNIDGGLLGPTNIHAEIMDRRIMCISLACALKSSGWFSRSAPRETKTGEGVANCTLGLRDALCEQSMFDGQGIRQCAYRAGAKQSPAQNVSNVKYSHFNTVQPHKTVHDCFAFAPLWYRE